MFARYIAKLFGTAARTPIRNDNRSRLNLEGCETRLTPASMYWTGGASSASVLAPANWSGNRYPAPGDDLYFYGNPSVAAGTGANKNCDDFGLVVSISDPDDPNYNRTPAPSPCTSPSAPGAIRATPARSRWQGP